ncbi:MAG TPA: ARMT1-like domain-containing protein, partial [Atribacteraceae bacterium]|nr:ARMT1-like domain-containing protein [Atribacteraceae bacterium]
VRINQIARVLTTGRPEIGFFVESAPSQLQEIWKKADLIISKGQGNFETLSDRPETIFFFLKAKCLPVARALGVNQGALILKKNRG